jgi:CBS domain containing-hemolysin-like protein
VKPAVRLVLAGFASAASVGTAAAYLLLGPVPAAMFAVAATLWLIWRLDNWTGSCLILAVLLLLVLAALTLLVGLTALRR